MEWLASQNPAWIFMIFPVIFACAFASVAWTIRKEKQLEANPHRMDECEYKDYNLKRFRK